VYGVWCGMSLCVCVCGVWCVYVCWVWCEYVCCMCVVWCVCVVCGYQIGVEGFGQGKFVSTITKANKKKSTDILLHSR